MKNELVRNPHSVGECNLHLQITPAYRQDVFVDPLVRELTVAYLIQKAQQMKIHVAAVESGPDHVHLFIENWKNYSIPKIAQSLKNWLIRLEKAMNYTRLKRMTEPLVKISFLKHMTYPKRSWLLKVYLCSIPNC